MPVPSRKPPPDPAHDPASPPPLTHGELRAILDDLATLTASVSDRVDDQNAALGKLNKTAAEARQAAFAARSQTDPKLVEKAVDAATRDAVLQLASMASALGEERREARNAAEAAHKELAGLKAALAQALGADKDRRRRRRVQLPLLAVGALLLLLLLALVLPRFMVLSSDRCWLYGGVWLRYTNSYNDACVFQTGW